MQIKTAMRKMQKIAKEEFHSLRYEITIYKKQISRIECITYMHDYAHYTGDTWKEAIAKLEKAIKERKAKPKKLKSTEAPKDESLKAEGK